MLRTALVSSLLVASLATPCFSDTSTVTNPAEAVVSDTGIKEQPVLPKSDETVLVKNENAVENVTALDTRQKTDSITETKEEKDEEESSEICDPIAPINEAVFHFNDKLYYWGCLLYTSPSPRDGLLSRMPSSA